MTTTAPSVQPLDVVRATLMNPVRPGDLIRAELINAVVSVLVDLEDRVTALEGSVPPTGAVQIVAISPTTPRVGDRMTIIGRNFDVSVRATAVRFNATLVPGFDATSSDTQLSFIVPDVPGVGEPGTQVTLTVSNFSTTATRLVTLLPRPQVFQGNIDIEYVDASPAPLAAGQAALIRFVATSDGTPEVTVALSASASTGWTGIQIMDAGSPPQLIASRQITVPAHGEVEFTVQVPIPSGIANGTAFTLTVEAAGGGTAASQLRQLAVGQTPPPPDPDIKIDFRGIDGGTLAGSTINVAAAALAEITLDVQFAQAGDYDFTIALAPPATAWTVQTDAAQPTAATPSFKVVAADIGADHFAHRPVAVDVTAPAAAGDTPQLSITAKRRGAALQRDLTYILT